MELDVRGASAGTEYGEEVAMFINALTRNIDPNIATGLNFNDAVLSMGHSYINAIMGRHLECPAAADARLKQEAQTNELIRGGQTLQASLVAMLSDRAVK